MSTPARKGLSILLWLSFAACGRVHEADDVALDPASAKDAPDLSNTGPAPQVEADAPPSYEGAGPTPIGGFPGGFGGVVSTGGLGVVASTGGLGVFATTGGLSGFIAGLGGFAGGGFVGGNFNGLGVPLRDAGSPGGDFGANEEPVKPYSDRPDMLPYDEQAGTCANFIGSLYACVWTQPVLPPFRGQRIDVDYERAGEITTLTYDPTCTLPNAWRFGEDGPHDAIALCEGTCSLDWSDQGRLQVTIQCTDLVLR